MQKYFFLSFLLTAFLFAGQTLSATEYGPISVQSMGLVDGNTQTSHGYVEYRFRITNRDSKAHQVTIEMPTDTVHYGTSLGRIADSAEVPPQSTVMLRILQPPIRMGNNIARIAMDGRPQKETVVTRDGYGHMTGWHSSTPAVAHVLASQGVPAELRDYFQAGVPQEETPLLEGEVQLPPAPAVTVPSSPSPPEITVARTSVPLSEWSDHWLAYSRFDAVALTSQEWRELQEQHAEIYHAVRQYVEVGGMLCIIGTDWTPPKEWTNYDGKHYSALLGEAVVLAATPAAAKPDIADFRNRVLGRGTQWRDALGSASTAGTIMSGNTNLLDAMPVVADYGVNVKLIMVLIIVFALLIGPANIFVLSKMRRRIWLLWTVPVTSTAAALLVLGVSLFQEGLLRQCSSASYTILDQRRQEAVTFGFVGYYATLTPSGIVFSPDTEATACVDRERYGNHKTLETQMTAGGSQFFYRGWISARVPSYFAVRKIESLQKRRIAFDWSGDKPSATNGLGVDIKNLSVRGPSGEFYTVQNIKAGDKVELANPVKSDSKPTWDDTAMTIRANAANAFFAGPHGRLLSDFEKTIPAGSYYAEIDAWNPFLEPGIERMKPYRVSTTIIGIFE